MGTTTRPKAEVLCLIRECDDDDTCYYTAKYVKVRNGWLLYCGTNTAGFIIDTKDIEWVAIHDIFSQAL